MDAIIWKNKQFYVGQTFEGKPHGQGHLTVSDSQHYEGEFYKGFYHGQGSLNIKNDSWKNIQAFEFKDGFVVIEGLWQYGVFEMSANSDIHKHLEKSLTQEQLANTVISPQNQQEIFQTLPVKT